MKINKLIGIIMLIISFSIFSSCKADDSNANLGKFSESTDKKDITIADGVIYKYVEIESDPGEKLSQYDAAVGLYKRALVYVYTEYKYDKDNPIYIKYMGISQVEEEECYLFEVETTLGEEYFMVSYNGNIYQMREGGGLRGWGNINDG